jgi:hypothetical protein
LLEFTGTPTEFEAYTELWVITPDGRRILYVDPGAAAEEVGTYHDFDRIEAGTVRVDRQGADGVEITLAGEDDTHFRTRLSLGWTLGTTLLNTVIAVTPDAILQSSLGTTVSTASLNALVDARGLDVAGRTETGRRYRLDASHLSAIDTARGTIDETDLGGQAPPGRPIEFGDAKTTGDPLFIDGTLHLERVEE